MKNKEQKTKHVVWLSPQGEDILLKFKMEYLSYRKKDINMSELFERALVDLWNSSTDGFKND